MKTRIEENKELNNIYNIKVKNESVKKEYGITEEIIRNISKEKNEILQMLMLNPKLAILDETDSGLDVDAIKTVSKGIKLFKNDNNSVLIITHSTKILKNLDVDYVHILVDGKIVKTGNIELVKDIEEKGYEAYK